VPVFRLHVTHHVGPSDTRRYILAGADGAKRGAPEDKVVQLWRFLPARNFTPPPMPSPPRVFASDTAPAPAVSAPYLLLSFVDTLADLLEVVGALTVGVALLASAGVGAASWILSVLLSFLLLLLVVQVGASFFCVSEHVRLALLGASVSLSLALSVGSLLAFVAGWWGWRLLAISAAPVLLVAAVRIADFCLSTCSVQPSPLSH
jgi:hypothetical protein